MRRGGPIARRTWLRHGTKALKRSPLKARGRRGSLFPHRRSPDFLAWIRTFQCFAIGAHAGRVEAAHVKTRGAGGDDVGNALPLCTRHHRLQHTIGIRTFERQYWHSASMAATADHLGVMWRVRQGQPA